jgi:chemotaxis family two-component system response regulator PixG
MTLISLTKELDNISKYSDGELILRNHHVIWHLYLVRGQLLYAISEIHRVRRWDRALKQHCSKWNWKALVSQSLDNQPWECQILDLGLSQKQLSLIQANSIIRTVFQECLFDLISYADLKSDWKPSQEAISTSTYCRVVSLSHQGIQSVFTKVMHIHKKWQAEGLSHLCPNLVPVLQYTADPQKLPVHNKYLNGEFTLWDIAWQTEQSVTEVTCSLMPWFNKGIIQFLEVPDTPLVFVPQPVVTPQPSVSPTHSLYEPKPIESVHKQPVIACIDDSPVLALSLKKILTSAGYQVLIIPEPMRGFSELIEHKPDVILLDLHLPNADGYSVCKFLRDTPVFKNTPIIILTANNTPIDRARAHLAGATEFLSKPPQTQQLLLLIKKYLGH